jgi:hypothetical protein
MTLFWTSVLTFIFDLITYFTTHKQVQIHARNMPLKTIGTNPKISTEIGGETVKIKIYVLN